MARTRTACASACAVAPASPDRSPGNWVCGHHSDVAQFGQSHADGGCVVVLLRIQVNAIVRADAGIDGEVRPCDRHGDSAVLSDWARLTRPSLKAERTGSDRWGRASAELSPARCECSDSPSGLSIWPAGCRHQGLGVGVAVADVVGAELEGSIRWDGSPIAGRLRHPRNRAACPPHPS